jgi:hypothetical protein
LENSPPILPYDSVSRFDGSGIDDMLRLAPPSPMPSMSFAILSIAAVGAGIILLLLMTLSFFTVDIGIGAVALLFSAFGTVLLFIPAGRHLNTLVRLTKFGRSSIDISIQPDRFIIYHHSKWGPHPWPLLFIDIVAVSVRPVLSLSRFLNGVQHFSLRFDRREWGRLEVRFAGDLATATAIEGKLQAACDLRKRNSLVLDTSHKSFLS